MSNVLVRARTLMHFADEWNGKKGVWDLNSSDAYQIYFDPKLHMALSVVFSWLQAQPFILRHIFLIQAIFFSVDQNKFKNDGQVLNRVLRCRGNWPRSLNADFLITNNCNSSTCQFHESWVTYLLTLILVIYRSLIIH